jgi:ankyrin repeat protein
LRRRKKRRKAQRKQKSKDEALRYACQHDDLHQLVFLLSEGANPYSQNRANQSALFIASAYGHVKVVKILCKGRLGLQHVRGPSGAYPQHIAADNGHLACLRALVEQKMAPTDQLTFDGRTPLYMACQSGHADCARYLIEEAYVNPFMSDKNGVTPLHIATHLGHSTTIDVLLPIRKEETPVASVASVASGNICADTQTRLLARQDCAGYTPLHTAACLGLSVVCQTLLDRGANPRILNDLGRDAVQVARDMGHHFSALICGGSLEILRAVVPSDDMTQQWSELE